MPNAICMGFGFGICFGAIVPSGSGDPPSDPPENTVAPALSKQVVFVGDVLSVTHGTWTNSPTSFAYQWLRSGNEIGGETASSYIVQFMDIPFALSCRVTATNAIGDSAPQSSNATTGVYDPALVVSGAGTNRVNGGYQANGSNAGRTIFEKIDDSGVRFIWDGDNNQWLLQVDFVVYYYSNDSVDYPYDVSSWNTSNGANPTPTVTA